MGKWGIYFFGLACLFWALFITGLYLDTMARLESYHRPYKAKYSLMRDLDLYFKILETYDEMEKFNKLSMGAGDWSWPRTWAYCLQMDTYIQELRHRQVGDIIFSSMKQVDKNHLLAEAQDFDVRHQYYGH